ncbi:MAG: transcriptional regulator, partial [Candidatus Methylomirabilia bacterium]
MAQAKSLIDEIKRDLNPVEREIRSHPYLAELEAGRLARDTLRLFAGEQYHIIRSDLRSVALLVNRFGATESGPFFHAVLGGEAAALEALKTFASAVGFDEARLKTYEPAAGAQGYPAFMAWLALYGSDAEVAASF